MAEDCPAFFLQDAEEAGREVEVNFVELADSPLNSGGGLWAVAAKDLVADHILKVGDFDQIRIGSKTPLSQHM